MHNHTPITKRSKRIFALLLSLMLVFAAMSVNIPQAAAADEPQTETTEPDNASQPTEEPQPSEEPTPSAESSPSEEPSPSAQPTQDTLLEPQTVEINGASCVNGEVIVKMKSASEPLIMNTLEAAGGAMLESLSSEGLMLADVPEGESTQSYIDKLQAQPNVEYVQPNYIYTLDRSFNDPGIPYQWYLSKINAFGAWDVTTGSPDIKVAVIDSGLDYTHPEFAGKVYAQTDTLDNDGDAFDDIDEHGTHVAGIIAANAGNGVGIAGVAPGVQLIIVDAFNGRNSNTFVIMKGVQYAVAHGADIINMSFGGEGNDRALESAINNAVSSGVVCVAAAGNESTSAPSYPSDYDSVISVIATAENDTKSALSNYGSAKDISAPGENIWSTVPGNSYESWGGTSMATPVVCGVIALMLSANPGLTVGQVKDILYSTADDLGAPGKDNTFGYGRVNAYKAVSTNAIPSVGISFTKTDVTLYGGSDGTVGLTASGGTSGSFQYSINGGGSWQSSGVFSGLPAGSYAAVARDAGYTSNSASCTVTIGQPPSIGNIPAKKIPSKPNAGTAVTIIPPAAPRGYTLQSVTYSSSNPSVASVDSHGNVTFLAGGKATIIIKIVSQTVDRKGHVKTKITTVKKTVTVKQPVASISLNLGDTTIARTQRVKLMTGISPATASNKKVKWTSSNPKVASVSSSGVVTGKAGGTAVITCRATDGSGASASCTVNVTPIYTTGVKMNKTALTVKLGKTASLKATVAPRNTDFKKVTWASSNPGVATVDAKGKVRAVASGTAVITVTTNGGQVASCTVTVP